MTDQFVVLGVARVRASWFRDLSSWSNSAALPVDFVKCMSLDEVRARLSSGRAFSAVLIDASLPGLDRDLTETAHASGCAVVAVSDGRARRDWRQIGVDAVLPEPAARETVLATLHEHARPVSTFTDVVDLAAVDVPPLGWRGQLVAVIGGGGSGRSTLAMGVAQGLARVSGHVGSIALADLSRRADLALLHDARDVVPGVQELTEACRTTALSPDDVRALTFWCPDRGYHLLLGLRRPRDWTALRPRSFEVAIDALQRTFGITVTDGDADLEGEQECGSVDVEERNLMSRIVLRRSDVVVVIGTASVSGLHRVTRIIDDVLRFGVEAERLLVIVNRAPRGPRQHAEIARAVATSVAALQGAAAGLASPMFVPARRHLDDAHHDAVPLPRTLVDPLAAAVRAVLSRVERPTVDGPMPVAPGSLGAWRISDR